MAIALTMLAVVIARGAEGVEGVLTPFPEGDKGAVLVWKSAKAMQDGRSLMRAGAAPQLIVPLLACAPSPGTRAVLGSTDPGLFLREVIIIHGQWAGCRGVIPSENFKKTKD